MALSAHLLEGRFALELVAHRVEDLQREVLLRAGLLRLVHHAGDASPEVVAELVPATRGAQQGRFTSHELPQRKQEEGAVAVPLLIACGCAPATYSLVSSIP